MEAVLSRLIYSVPKLRVYFSTTCLRCYAAPDKSIGIAGLGKKKLVAKTGPTLEKKVIPAETDPYKLVNYCCGSCITKEGEDVKIKEDNEYPEWLWKLRTGGPPPLEEIEYDTKYYWTRLRRTAKTQQLKLMKLRKF